MASVSSRRLLNESLARGRGGGEDFAESDKGVAEIAEKAWTGEESEAAAAGGKVCEEAALAPMKNAAAADAAAAGSRCTTAAANAFANCVANCVANGLITAPSIEDAPVASIELVGVAQRARSRMTKDKCKRSKGEGLRIGERRTLWCLIGETW